MILNCWVPIHCTINLVGIGTFLNMLNLSNNGKIYK